MFPAKTNTTMKTFFSILTLTVVASIAIAADFCVAPKSGDGNTGTKEKPLPTLEAARADRVADAKAGFDPLECRWTFGNHEPLAMYRRVGGRSTGGADGGAAWLEAWHHWFDSNASTRIMEELGLNMLHSRFYKGMGWRFESRDFPKVKQFVANCHQHGIRAMAYVQFSTLYYEVMLDEVPDLADWAAVDEHGRKRTYHGGAYYRWLPCINAPAFEPYLKKVIRIALEEGGFDGIMFDNCPAPPCHCPRCVALFRKHLAQERDPETRFGIPTVAHVLPPVRAGYGEAQDPIYQEWVAFRCQRLTELFRRLYRFSKTCKPSALVAGNVTNIRQANMAAAAGLSVTDLRGCFDIFVSQSGNEPGLRDGCIVNRVREMKLAQALGTDILALSDSDAGISSDSEAKYLLNLMETAVFGGIPADRTVMQADPQMVSRPLVEFRKPLLQRFNETVRAGREGLKRPTFAPVRLLYSRESLMFSEQAHNALLAAEEIMLRNHVPYGLLPTDAVTPLKAPADCEAILVCDQKCLSDTELAALARFADNGGRLVVTGQSGLYDGRYHQRRVNPLTALDGRRNVARRAETDSVSIRGSGWTIKVAAPKDYGRRLMADLGSVWSAPIGVEAPGTVFVEIKQSGRAFSVHLLNYAPKPVQAGVRIELRADPSRVARCSFAAPMEGRAAVPITPQTDERRRCVFHLPGFSDYAIVEIGVES
jgi:hypothetical protein